MTKGQNDDNVIKMPLRSSPKSVEDFIVLAEQTDDDEEIMDLLEKALEAANQNLGQTWEAKYQGRGWQPVETVPLLALHELLPAASFGLTFYSIQLLLNFYDQPTLFIGC